MLFWNISNRYFLKKKKKKLKIKGTKKKIHPLFHRLTVTTVNSVALQLPTQPLLFLLHEIASCPAHSSSDCLLPFSKHAATTSLTAGKVRPWLSKPVLVFCPCSQDRVELFYIFVNCSEYLLRISFWH